MYIILSNISLPYEILDKLKYIPFTVWSALLFLICILEFIAYQILYQDLVLLSFVTFAPC